MRGRAAIGLLALSALAWVGPTGAQTFASSPEIVAALATRIDGFGPVLTWVEEPALLTPKPWTVVGLYREGVARGVRSRGGQIEISWLRIATCPAFEKAMTALGEVQVSLRSPLSSTFPGMTRDGTTVTIRESLAVSGDPAKAVDDLRFSASSGPAADWAFATDKAIESCWSGSPPPEVKPKG